MDLSTNIALSRSRYKSKSSFITKNGVPAQTWAYFKFYDHKIFLFYKKQFMKGIWLLAFKTHLQRLQQPRQRKGKEKAKETEKLSMISNMTDRASIWESLLPFHLD